MPHLSFLAWGRKPQAHAAAADRNWTGCSALASCRTMASRRPRASHASAARGRPQCTPSTPQPMRYTGLGGQAHATVAPRLVKDHRRSART
jgi:hypothetical protein